MFRQLPLMDGLIYPKQGLCFVVSLGTMAERRTRRSVLGAFTSPREAREAGASPNCTPRRNLKFSVLQAPWRRR